MKVTVTREVERCYDCPHFENHPQEATCELIPNVWHIIAHSEARVQIHTECPLKKKDTGE